MGGKPHFDKLLALIDVERDAEKAQNLRELRKFPVAQREALGKTVGSLTIDGVESGMGNMPLLTLSRANKGEELAPFHNMSNGDNVLVTFPAGTEPPSLEGTMYKVEEYRCTVALSAPPPPDWTRGGACQIDLLGSDATYRRMKKALVHVSEAKKNRVAELRELFIGEAKPERKPKLKKGVDWYNEGLNEFQRDAVAVCLAAEDAALVHGPPGTGKTTVLVEVIRQHCARGMRVLATAPSNIAVDNMLEKLHDSGLRVVRMGHPARTLEYLRHHNLAALVDEDPAMEEVKELDAWRERLIKQKSRFGRGQLGVAEKHEREREVQKLWRQARDIEFEVQKRILASAQVVLATHGGLSRKMLKGEFDLVVLDEASQATEPLSWIPLAMGRKAVFAGDSMQLPPTIYSKEAAEAGLSTTLFDRLKDVLPAHLQTLLRVQYRMHETIMGFSSQQFYEGKLIAHETVAKHTADEIANASELTSVPLVYVDTAGAGFEESWNDLLESRENKGEAELAVKLLEELLGSGLKPENVALLTPYVAQARLLKSMAKIPGLEIGSVDGFQGREKEATIVSLVRSNDDAEVGFLGDTRRMNVAMTRARRLLIVIGDSATLGQHPFYSKFIEYADDHDAHRSSYEF